MRTGAQTTARHRDALLDWLACAIRGAREPAARTSLDAGRLAGGGLIEKAAWLGTCGHVLDFDDTYEPGLAHLSAAVAPAAIALGAALDRDVAAVSDAFARGFEAMGELTAAAHPHLYDGGWHPTAICAGAGAAIAASRLLGLDAERSETACALALARAAGVRGTFGSDGKALQVGEAAGEGIRAALLARAGARIDLERVSEGADGFAGVFGLPPGAIRAWRAGIAAAVDPERAPGSGAVTLNWIKAYPCCLQTHAAIDACLEAVAGKDPSGLPVSVSIEVHPISLKAASLNDVASQVRTGLEAKFSIAYTAAYALIRGAPGIESFEALDPEVARFAAESVGVRADDRLLPAEAVVQGDGRELARVRAPLGSPGNPMSAVRLAEKVGALAGERLAGLLEDPSRSANALLGPIESTT